MSKAQSFTFLLSRIDYSSGDMIGGTVTFCEAGVDTLKDVYLDRLKNTTAANPYTLDGSGSAQLFGDGVYRVVVKDALGATRYDWDDIEIVSLDSVFADARSVTSVATIADLRLRAGLFEGEIIKVAGYHVAFDGGGGPDRQWSSSATADDNGGNCIDPSVGGSGRWLARLTDMQNVKFWGAKGDGTADDTVEINTAETFMSASGGGKLFFPAGTYMVSGLTKRSSTIWQGEGWGVSTIKLIAGAQTTAVVSTLNSYTLWGSDSLNGVTDFAIRDLTIDGNRSNGSISDGLNIYGWCYDVKNVEIKSCNGRGLRSEYGTPGIEAHQNVQSQFSDMLIWDNETDGVYFCGPNDSSFKNINVYWNLRYGIHTAVRGTGKFTDCHVWSDAAGGRQHTVGWRLDTNVNMLLDCVGEGSTAYQVWLRSIQNIIIGGNYFYYQSGAGVNTVGGIVIGDLAVGGISDVPSYGNVIKTRVDNCQAGAVIFFNDDGYNNIDIDGINNNATSSGYSGTPDATNNYVRMSIVDAGTNPLLNFSTLGKDYYGVTSYFGGIAIFGLGGVADGGAVSVGAADSAGTGYRTLRVPN